MNEDARRLQLRHERSRKGEENSSLCWQLLLPDPAEAAPAWSGFSSLSLRLFFPHLFFRPSAAGAGWSLTLT